MALCRDRCWVWVDLVGATNSADGVMNDDEPRGQVNAQGEYSIDLGNCDTMDEILEHFGADSVRRDTAQLPLPLVVLLLLPLLLLLTRCCRRCAWPRPRRVSRQATPTWSATRVR